MHLSKSHKISESLKVKITQTRIQRAGIEEEFEIKLLMTSNSDICVFKYNSMNVYFIYLLDYKLIKKKIINNKKKF